MKKKEVALVFGITSNYIFALANTLIGLVNNNKKFWDDIIVYYDEMDDKSIERINQITKCKFVNFSKQEYIKKLPQEVLSKYSEACFYRYDCFDLLKEYKTVIWNDVDVLIQNDISGLVDYGKEGGLGITQNTIGLINEANFTDLILDYNMFTPLYNSGILVFHDTLPDYETMREWCIKKTVEYSEILRWPDQAIINILIQQYNIKVDLIDINKYCCHPSQNEYIKDAAIIHAYGDEKFWNTDYLKQKFPEWAENEKKWNSICLKNNQKKSVTSNAQPLVSCIMSTYNRYDYLKEAVESILKQTYTNFELIVVLEKCDNQDKIEKVLESFNDKRIVIVKNKERLGFPKSLNVGIDMAKGKYVARMDDDDISLPLRFEKQVEYLEEHPDVGILGTNARFFGKYNTEIGVETDENVLKVITLYRCPFIHPTVMMNKQLLDDNNLRYNPEYFTEDYELWSRAVGCFKVGNLKEILLHYRASGDGLTSGQNEIKIHNSHKKIMRNQFKNYLGLDLNENEIEVIQGRKNIFDKCFNFDNCVSLKRQTCQKIILANKKCNYYDQQTIENIFSWHQFGQDICKKDSFVKKVAKKILGPIYRRLMNRVEDRIIEHDSHIYNYVNNRLNDLDAKIDKKEK